VSVPSLDETRIAPETSLGSAPADEAAKGPTETPVNEIVKTAQIAKDKEEGAAKSNDGNRNAWIAAGVGVGIGSAALVAALLYTNRDKGKDKKKD
jgi:hypothetical protein